jgi:hypothetical protein
MIVTATLEQLLPTAAARLGLTRFDQVRLLSDVNRVPDATLKIILRVASRPPFILILSNPVSPGMVRRNVERMRMARSMLSGITRDAIELPLIEGEWEGRSYALWSARRSLSSSRILFKIQKTAITPSILDWINDVGVQTLRQRDPLQLASYIERLIRVCELPEHIKTAANAARLDCLAGRIEPVRVLQHGDLWIGNVLRAPTVAGFVVIDWPGATLDGVPFFDLVKFACSIGASPRRLRRYISQYGAMVGCNVNTAMPYVLAGLGRLYLELENCPKDRFLSLCEQKISALRAAL